MLIFEQPSEENVEDVHVRVCKNRHDAARRAPAWSQDLTTGGMVFY